MTLDLKATVEPSAVGPFIEGLGGGTPNFNFVVDRPGGIRSFNDPVAHPGGFTLAAGGREGCPITFLCLAGDCLV